MSFFKRIKKLIISVLLVSFASCQFCYAGEEEDLISGSDETDVNSSSLFQYAPTFAASAIGVGLTSLLAYSLFGNRDNKDSIAPTSTPTPEPAPAPEPPPTPTPTFLDWELDGLSSNLILSLSSVGSTLYAGTYSNGVYKKENVSWTAINGKAVVVLGGAVPALCTFSNKLYAGCANYVAMYDSINDNWSKVGGDKIAEIGNVQTIYPISSTLCAGISNSQNTHGVFYDNGAAWANKVNLPSNTHISVLSSPDNSALYAGTGERLNNTANGIGVYKFAAPDCEQINGVLPNNGDLTITALSAFNGMLYSAANYYCANNGTAFGGVYKTALTNSEWTKCTDLEDKVQILSLYHLNGTLYAGSYGKVYKMTGTDECKWTQLGKTMNNDLGVYAIHAIGNVLYVGTDGGVYKISI